MNQPSQQSEGDGEPRAAGTSAADSPAAENGAAENGAAENGAGGTSAAVNAAAATSAAGRPPAASPAADPNSADWPPKELAGEPDPLQGEIAIDRDPTPGDPKPGEKGGGVSATISDGRASAAASTWATDSGTGPAADPAAESAVAAGASEASIPSGPSNPEEIEAAVARLAEARAALAARLFGHERPPRSGLQASVDAYARCVEAASQALSPADEAAALTELAARSHQRAVESERAEIAVSVEKAQAELRKFNHLFAELERLIEQAAEELKRLDENDARFQAAPEALRAKLVNHKQGVEIIHRMFTRVRKKEPAGQTPTLGETLESPSRPADLGGLGEFAARLSDAYHGLRDANYHACQDAAKYVKSCEEACVRTVKELLKGIDGIDGGLQNDSAERAAIPSDQSLDGDSSALIDSWFSAYPRLRDRVNQFCETTGIAAQTVDAGVRFDPDTMEPVGTEPHPDLRDEDVAAVVRRGFSLHGKQIRPIHVIVVRNS
jgi:molecular chaperone GrpE (heat shock protein)